VRKLHTGNTALLVDKSYDSGQWLDLIVTPYTEVLRTDPPLREDGCSLRKHQSRAAHRTASQMNEVPVVREPINARVLAHRRNEHAVRKFNISNNEWIK
jgi:hypothetical protein